jgi:hypothetical protein
METPKTLQQAIVHFWNDIRGQPAWSEQVVVCNLADRQREERHQFL